MTDAPISPADMAFIKKIAKPKHVRYIKSEIVARTMCADIRATHSGSIEVEWTKSRTWGMCPKIEYRRALAARASGCGYDKLSAVLAEALRWLGGDMGEQRAIYACQGCGVGLLERELLAQGWKLERVATGKTFDCYTITICPRVSHAAKG